MERDIHFNHGKDEKAPLQRIILLADIYGKRPCDVGVVVVAINICCATSWVRWRELQACPRPANDVGDGVITGSNPESDESREVRRDEEPDQTEGMNISACRLTP